MAGRYHGVRGNAAAKSMSLCNLRWTDEYLLAMRLQWLKKVGETVMVDFMH